MRHDWRGRQEKGTRGAQGSEEEGEGVRLSCFLP